MGRGEAWGMAWGGVRELAGGLPDCRALFPLSLEGSGKGDLVKEELEPEINNRERDLALGKERWDSGRKGKEKRAKGSGNKVMWRNGPLMWTGR